MKGQEAMSRNEKPLFIFEMANNHMGNVEHGLRIIREMREASAPFESKFQLAFKLQYRRLDTFIHPDFQGRDDVKYVKRFSETKLEDAEFRALKAEIDRLGFLSICTPFDEASVSRIEEHEISIIKIGSCSFTDWPLLERVAQSSKPIIASTAGIEFSDIDKVVSFFQHRNKDFSLMHCVAQYPTPPADLQLNQINLLQERYPGVPVGYSTHENPDQTCSVQMAIAKGAAMFEKHVGVATAEYPLNAYSANPQQVRRWLEAAADAFKICGAAGERCSFSRDEINSLRNLRRGVFANRAIRKGERLSAAELSQFLAIPTRPGQVTANHLSKYTSFHALADIAPNEAVMFSNVAVTDNRQKVHAIVDRVNRMIQQAGVVAPAQAEFEISHHYGLERFDETGATIINLVNREYCKKLIVVLPGQSHPEHMHKQKEETFLVLHGDIAIDLDGTARECGPGDIVVVERGTRHSFSSRRGVIMEEISSTHYKGDSYYTDPAIAPVSERKTHIAHWLGGKEPAAQKQAAA
jgi:N-acetylneuraminate synthase